MAAKPLRKFAIILVLVIAGIALAGVIESRLSLAKERDRKKFIATYLDLAIAREQYSEADSLSRAIDEIYRAHGADSVWMANYAMKMSKNLKRSGLIWEDIVGKLDSIRQVVAPDTITNPPPP